MSTYIQVQTTLSSAQEAHDLAKKVVVKQLAGCVQVTPCSSVYTWQGKVEVDQEFLCTMKSHLDLFPTLRDFILEVHPYDEPEIIAIPIVAGSEGYLHWLDGVLAKK